MTLVAVFESDKRRRAVCGEEVGNERVPIQRAFNSPAETTGVLVRAGVGESDVAVMMCMQSCRE